MINATTSLSKIIRRYVSCCFFLTLTLFLTQFFLAPVHAQNLPDPPMVTEPKIGGMHSMTITPMEKKPPQTPLSSSASPIPSGDIPLDQSVPTPSPKDSVPAPISAQDYIPLPMDKILIRQEDFAPWPSLAQLKPLKSPAQKQALIKAIEDDRAHVSPQILFLAAQLFSLNGDHEHAALYLLVGQLRLSFDQARYAGKLPSESKNDDVAEKTRDRNKTKTADQALPTANTDLKQPTRAHAQTEQLAQSVAPPIFQWLVKHPAQMSRLIDAARAWDEATPYGYELGYEVGTPAPFDQWPKILKSTRSKYFTQLQQFQGALGGY